MKVLDRLSAWLAGGTRVIVVVAASVMMVSLLLQVISRYGFGQTFAWTEELALFLFTWTVLLAMTVAVREGAHVRLALLIDFAPSRMRDIWERVLDASVFGFGVIFAHSGWRYVDATLGQVSAAVRYPIEWLHLAAPVAGVLVALHALNRLLAPKDAAS